VCVCVVQQHTQHPTTMAEHKGADAMARYQQYEYKANSNLVIQAERHNLSKEPTGEVETLAGRKMKPMGDRARREKPSTHEKDRAAKRKKEDDEVKSRKRKRTGLSSVVDAVDSSGYHPKTRETRAAWENVLHLIHGFIGDQPQDILRGAAQEVLLILKDEALTDPVRQREAGQIIGPIADDVFASLVQLGKKITDFSIDEEENAGEGIDDELGVAVVFQEDNENEDADAMEGEVAGDDDEEEDEG